MNLSDKPDEVTCSYCKRKMAAVGLPKTRDAALPASMVSGIEVVIEAARGSPRWSGGKPSPAHYGYIRRVGSAEGATEWMDCFVGPNAYADRAFIVDMYRRDNFAFDEHKVMLGFDSMEDAVKAVQVAYHDLDIGPKDITPVSISNLRLWLRGGNHSAPYYTPPQGELFGRAA